MQARVVSTNSGFLCNMQGNCELLFTVSLFGTYIINVFCSTVRYFFPQTNKLDTLFIYLLFALLVLFSLREVLKRIRYWQVISCIGIFLILLISTIFSNNTEVHFAVMKNIVLECFPVFLLAGTVRDFSAVKRYMDKAAVITLYCLAYIIYVLDVGTLETGSGYSQYMSYYLLLPTIVLAGLLFEKFCVKALIPFSLGLFLMLSYGARGPLNCLVLYIAVKLLISFIEKGAHRKLVLIANLGTIGILLYLYYNKILDRLMSVFQDLGFSTRSVKMLMDSSFMTDTGRSQIYAYCYNRILSHPYLGTGVVNDRNYITNAIFSGDSPIGNYPHNIFLEIWMQFGIFVGTILLAAIMFVIFKGLSSRIPTDAKSIAWILVGAGFFPLLFSGSYIDSNAFYVLMGVCGTLAYPVRWNATKM